MDRVTLANILDRLTAAAGGGRPASFSELVASAGLDPLTDFVGATLQKVDLRGEDISNYNFSGADLTGANLAGANISGTSFEGAIMTDVIGYKKKKILIVEDNELNMKLLKDVLEAHGHQTLCTSRGRAGVRLARTHYPNLILMDLQLPGISGLEATKIIKNDDKLAKIPIVAVTAFAMKGDEEKARSNGFDGYVIKPIVLRDFLNLIAGFAA